MNRTKNQTTPQGETSRVVVEFLEVAITSIVFLKGFYPPAAFERRRYMNVVVQRARHPQLANYIHSSTFGLLPFIQKVLVCSVSGCSPPLRVLVCNVSGCSLPLRGLVERVVIFFYDKEHVPVERFVFKLGVNQTYSSEVEESGLEFALRAFLIKLPVAEPLTKPLPSGGSWEVTAYFRALPQESSSTEAGVWIPTDTKQWLQPPHITPIKSMSSEPLKLQLYLEHPSPLEPKDPAV